LNEWKDMADAPKDGTRILVASPFGGHALARWNIDEYSKHPKPYWQITGPWGTREMRLSPPTAWIPLPKLPPKPTE